MLLGKALGQGGSGSDALKSALFNTLAAVSFNAVGDYTNNRLTEGYPPKIMVHAMVGGLLAEATGGDFKTGALAAGLNEAAVGYLNTLVRGDKTLLSMSSQVVGVMAAASRGDTDASSIEKGGWVAKNATQYNHMLHQSQTQALDEQRQRHPEKADRLNAAACALTRCAESIPTDDPQYSQWKAFQDRGETYQEEVALLEGTGQFDGRSFIDWSDDQFGAYGNAVQKIGAARDTAVGLAGGAGGYGGMIATSPACVGIVTCTVPAALGTLGTLSLQDAWESAKGITAEFKPSEPQRVADSFQLGTFSGDESATTELLKDAAIVGAGATALGAAERAYRKVAGGFTVGAKGLSSVKHASGVELPKSQAQMIANFETAGYPSKPVVSPTSGNVVGTQYTLPDGSRVRVMQADGRSPQRASFENANGGPIDPTTGKPPQPPKGLSKAERKQWIRERTNIEPVD